MRSLSNLNYFSDYDPLKKVYFGRLYKEQEKLEDAYEVLESVIFSEHNTLNLGFRFLIDSTTIVEFMMCLHQIRKRKMLWKKILRLAVCSKI